MSNMLGYEIVDAGATTDKFNDVHDAWGNGVHLHFLDNYDLDNDVHRHGFGVSHDALRGVLD